MTPSHLPRASAVIGFGRFAMVASLAILLVLQAFVSLKWRMEHDTPLLHYVAFLMDQDGRMPYRDVFETSMPGAFAFHYAIGHFLGFDEATFQRVDLVLLSVLLGLTYWFMRRFGHLVGLGAAVLFGLLYFAQGSQMTLQRDYVGLLPLAGALALVPKDLSALGRTRPAILGVLVGLSVLIKPQLAIGLPILFWTLVRLDPGMPSRRRVLAAATSCLLGMLVPIAIAVWWLWRSGALGPFVDMTVHYLPLHNALTGQHLNLTREAFALYVIANTSRVGGYGALLLAAIAGVMALERVSDKGAPWRVSAQLVVASAAAYLLYPTLAAKFWDYHYMPTAYFLSLAVSFCLLGQPEPNARWRGLAFLLMFAVATTVQLPLVDTVRDVSTELSPTWVAPSPKAGRVDDTAAWLRERLRPGDTVQPLDWAEGGSIHAMLLARARLSTTFLYEYHFFHHLSSPVIQSLRRSFVTQLRRSPPRFIIKYISKKPMVSGVDSSEEFPELQEILAEYCVANSRNDIVIYERCPL